MLNKLLLVSKWIMVATFLVPFFIGFLNIFYVSETINILSPYVSAMVLALGILLYIIASVIKALTVRQDETPSSSTEIWDRLIVWFGIIPMVIIGVSSLVDNLFPTSHGLEPSYIGYFLGTVLIPFFILSIPVQVILVVPSILRRIQKIINGQLTLIKFLVSPPLVWIVLALVGCLFFTGEDVLKFI